MNDPTDEELEQLLRDSHKAAASLDRALVECPVWQLHPWLMIRICWNRRKQRQLVARVEAALEPDA